MDDFKIDIAITKIKKAKSPKTDDDKYKQFCQGSLKLLNMKSQKNKLELKLDDLIKKIVILEEELENIIEI